MPAPEKGESEQDYVSRFMASLEARKDYPDEKQRAAVAYSMYREKHTIKNCAPSAPSDKSSICKMCSGTCEKSKSISALNNQAQFGVMFKGNHLEPGLVRYDDIVNPITNQKGMTLLLDNEGIAAIRKTFIGKFVYNYTHKKDVKPEDIKGDAVGVVAGNIYNAETGWDEASFILWDSKAVENAVGGKFALSNSYSPIIDGIPGTHHGMPYDAKVIGGEYDHLAIVPNPRYEGSRIEAVHNSKETNTMADKKETLLQKVKMLFKMGGVDNSVEVDSTSKITVEGAEVTLGDLMTAHVTLQNAKAAEEAVKAISDETVVTLENGKTATVKELKADYITLKNSAAAPKKLDNEAHKEGCDCKACKEAAEKETPAEQKKEDKMKAENDLKVKNEADEKAKQEAFEKLKNAAETRPDLGLATTETPMMQADRLAAGNRI